MSTGICAVLALQPGSLNINQDRKGINKNIRRKRGEEEEEGGREV